MLARRILHEVKYLAGTFGLVLGIGVLSLQGFLVEPKIAAPSVEGSRAPASAGQLPGLSDSTPSKELGLEVIDWNCQEYISAAPVSASHVRIKSKACGKDVASFVVTNKTTGFKATVFAASEGFTTDFIDLVEGENSIVVQIQKAKGLSEDKTVKVLRRPSSESIKDVGSD